MSDIIIRALQRELEEAEQNLRGAFGRVSQLVAWREGANSTRHNNPRSAVPEAISIIDAAKKRWDDTYAELQKAGGKRKTS